MGPLLVGPKAPVVYHPRHPPRFLQHKSAGPTAGKRVGEQPPEYGVSLLSLEGVVSASSFQDRGMGAGSESLPANHVSLNEIPFQIFWKVESFPFREDPNPFTERLRGPFLFTTVVLLFYW